MFSYFLFMYILAGDLIYSRLLGKDIIVLNSEKIAKELLQNRSGNYSDRPYLITNELSVLHPSHHALVSIHS